MRLIDADALIENLREIKTLYGVPMTMRDEQMIHWIIGHIKEQPTAYDVEKVVAELEKQSYEIRLEGGALIGNWHSVIDTNIAIAKVRKGGIE